MKKVYQVRFRARRTSGIMNAHNNKYDVFETKEDAIEALKDFKKFHRETYFKNEWVEYTIVEIEYRETNVYKDRI